jgi:hypothetical protein
MNIYANFEKAIILVTWVKKIYFTDSATNLVIDGKSRKTN